MVLTFYDSTNLLPSGAKHSCEHKREKVFLEKAEALQLLLEESQFFYYRSVFSFHRNPLMLTPIYCVLVSPLLRDVIFVRVETSTFPATSVSQEDWVSLAFSQAEITALKTIGTVPMMLRGIVESCIGTEIPQKAEVQLIKHFPQEKCNTFLFCPSDKGSQTLTALFLKDPINIPAKFISHAVLLAGISPCYQKG